MKRLFVLSSLLISACVSFGALACGDSLYRVGKGVSYRIYTAPLPGSVLVYAQSEGARELAEALAQSGHDVRLVDNETDLSSELGSGGYDVVIAPYSEHEQVESTSKAAGAAKTTYLPVAVNDDEEKAAERTYSKVMLAEKDDIKNYLKAIHKTLKGS